MKKFFVLSGEESTLPPAELRALVETYASQAKLEKLSDRLILVDGAFDEKLIAQRAAYMRTSGVLLGSVKPTLDGTFLPSIDLPPEYRGLRTFAARTIKQGRLIFNASLESRLGGLIKQALPGTHVFLRKPELVFYHILSDRGDFIGASRGDVEEKNWKSRRPRARAFFHPSALYPKFARALVNLARVREGQVLLDPFCGTGSILIEASLVGLRPLGIDLSPEMCEGAKQNVRRLGRGSVEIVRGTAFQPPLVRCDGMVTDLPYGRCASTMGIAPPELVQRAVKSFSEVLERGRFCVLVHSHRMSLPSLSDFTLEEQHHLYIHRNLTRVISVLRRR